MKAKSKPIIAKTQDEIAEDHRIARMAQSMMAVYGMNFDYENDPDTMARINGEISIEDHTNKVEGYLKKAIKKK